MAANEARRGRKEVAKALFVLAVAQSRARDPVCLLMILMRLHRRGGRKRIVAPHGPFGGQATAGRV
jgi:hypothetical protein